MCFSSPLQTFEVHCFGESFFVAGFFEKLLPPNIEILGLEGESTNEKWTIFLGYQGKFTMVLPSAARLGHLLLKYFFG
jgi:hypothetical protein